MANPSSKWPTGDRLAILLFLGGGGLAIMLVLLHLTVVSVVVLLILLFAMWAYPVFHLVSIFVRKPIYRGGPVVILGIGIIWLGIVQWRPIRNGYKAEYMTPEHTPTANEIAADVAKLLPQPLAPPNTPPAEPEKAKGQDGAPFSFAVEVGIVSPGVGNFTGFWAETGSPQGCVLMPINDLLFFRVSNIQPTPKLLINYAVEVQIKGQWRPLKKVKLAYRNAIETLTSNEEKGQSPQGGGILEFPSGGNKNMYPMMSVTTGQGDLKQARLVQFPIFDLLIGGQTLAQGQSVRGWSGFQFPALINLNDLRMKVTDENGKTFMVKATVIKSGPDDDLTPHPITIASLVDVSRCSRGSDY